MGLPALGRQIRYRKQKGQYRYREQAYDPIGKQVGLSHPAYPLVAICQYNDH
jgi:hypothetical protein